MLIWRNINGRHFKIIVLSRLFSSTQPHKPPPRTGLAVAPTRLARDVTTPTQPLTKRRSVAAGRETKTRLCREVSNKPTNGRRYVWNSLMHIFYRYKSAFSDNIWPKLDQKMLYLVDCVSDGYIYRVSSKSLLVSDVSTVDVGSMLNFKTGKKSSAEGKVLFITGNYIMIYNF